MLNNFVLVSDMIHEELLSTLHGASPSSDLGKHTAFTNTFLEDTLHNTWKLNKSLAQAAFQLTDYKVSEKRCKCLASKTLAGEQVQFHIYHFFGAVVNISQLKHCFTIEQHLIGTLCSL